MLAALAPYLDGRIMVTQRVANAVTRGCVTRVQMGQAARLHNCRLGAFSRYKQLDDLPWPQGPCCLHLQVSWVVHKVFMGHRHPGGCDS